MDKDNNIQENFEYLKNISKTMYEINNDDKILIEKLNLLSKEDINKIIDEYSSERFGPIKFIRLIIAYELKNNKITLNKIEEIKNKVKNKDTEYFKQYNIDDKFFIGLNNLENNKDIFRKHKTNFNLLYKFFVFPNKSNIEIYLNEICDFIVEVLNLTDYVVKLNIFAGPRSNGEDSMGIYIYSRRLNDYKYSLQLSIEFRNGNIYSKTIKGSECKIDYEGKEKKCSNIQECIDFLQQNKEEIIKLNKSLIDKENKDSKVLDNRENMNNKIKQPLNQILYGPPGTGKTYNTVIKAMEIITFEDMFKNWYLNLYCKNNKVENEEKTINYYIKHINKINTEFLKTDNIFKYYDKEKFSKLKEDILDSKYMTEDSTRNNPNSYYKHCLIRYEEFLEWLTYEKIKEEFDKLKTSGQIEFITFHQSYSYEEFIEGIKPDLGNNTIKYKLEPGILRMICDNAKKITVDKTYDKIDFSKTRIFKMSLGANWEDETEDIYNYCLKNNVVALGWGGDKDFSQCNDLQDFKKLDNSWGANAVAIFKNWMRVGDVILISNGNSNIKAIAQITGNYEYHNDTEINYCHYRKVNWLYSGDNISISKIYDKKLSQQTIYGFYDEKREGETDYNTTIKTDVINGIITGNINKLEEKNYVLIIDEINRGNISKIFGEMITLIEEDKRIGNEHELKLTLPYSKKPFGIPNNLYIIGTMNTSDRSIASVDIALRRRFKFIEMMPQKNLVAKFEIDFDEIFEKLNNKIKILLDRDHQIGHSYFIKTKYNDDNGNNNIETLRNIWFDEILPLLNEYFYNDWEKLQALLGAASNNNDSFIVVKETKLPFYQYDIEDKVYDFIDNLNNENFKSALLKIIEEPKSKQKETNEQ